jgi:hypothetical protein
MSVDIERLEDAMRKLPQFVPVTRHYFADGMYCREVFRPADTLITGKVHKKEHFYMVMSGTVAIVGQGQITGPTVIVSQPGTKRVVYAVTDATCLTVHRTALTDLDEIEAELVEYDGRALFDARNELKAPAIEGQS